MNKISEQDNKALRSALTAALIVAITFYRCLFFVFVVG